MNARKFKALDVYHRLKMEGFNAYLSDDVEYLVFLEMGVRGMMSVKILEDERYALISSDEMQSMYFDSIDKLFEVIFFVSHCQK